MQIGDVSEENFKSSETDAALQDETVKLSNMKSRLYFNLLIIGLFQLTATSENGLKKYQTLSPEDNNFEGIKAPIAQDKAPRNAMQKAAVQLENQTSDPQIVTSSSARMLLPTQSKSHRQDKAESINATTKEEVISAVVGSILTKDGSDLLSQTDDSTLTSLASIGKLQNLTLISNYEAEVLASTLGSSKSLINGSPTETQTLFDGKEIEHISSAQTMAISNNLAASVFLSKIPASFTEPSPKPAPTVYQTNKPDVITTATEKLTRTEEPPFLLESSKLANAIHNGVTPQQEELHTEKRIRDFIVLTTSEDKAGVELIPTTDKVHMLTISSFSQPNILPNSAGTVSTEVFKTASTPADNTRKSTNIKTSMSTIEVSDRPTASVMPLTSASIRHMLEGHLDLVDETSDVTTTITKQSPDTLSTLTVTSTQILLPTKGSLMSTASSESIVLPRVTRPVLSENIQKSSAPFSKVLLMSTTFLSSTLFQDALTDRTANRFQQETAVSKAASTAVTFLSLEQDILKSSSRSAAGFITTVPFVQDKSSKRTPPHTSMETAIPTTFTMTSDTNVNTSADGLPSHLNTGDFRHVTITPSTDSQNVIIPKTEGQGISSVSTIRNGAGVQSNVAKSTSVAHIPVKIPPSLRPHLFISSTMPDVHRGAQNVTPTMFIILNPKPGRTSKPVSTSSNNLLLLNNHSTSSIQQEVSSLTSRCSNCVTTTHSSPVSSHPPERPVAKDLSRNTTADSFGSFLHVSSEEPNTSLSRKPLSFQALSDVSTPVLHLTTPVSPKPVFSSTLPKLNLIQETPHHKLAPPETTRGLLNIEEVFKDITGLGTVKSITKKQTISSEPFLLPKATMPLNTDTTFRIEDASTLPTAKAPSLVSDVLFSKPNSTDVKQQQDLPSVQLLELDLTVVQATTQPMTLPASEIAASEVKIQSKENVTPPVTSSTVQDMNKSNSSPKRTAFTSKAFEIKENKTIISDFSALSLHKERTTQIKSPTPTVPVFADHIKSQPIENTKDAGLTTAVRSTLNPTQQFITENIKKPSTVNNNRTQVKPTKPLTMSTVSNLLINTSVPNSTTVTFQRTGAVKSTSIMTLHATSKEQSINTGMQAIILNNVFTSGGTGPSSPKRNISYEDQKQIRDVTTGQMLMSHNTIQEKVSIPQALNAGLVHTVSLQGASVNTKQSDGSSQFPHTDTQSETEFLQPFSEISTPINPSRIAKVLGLQDTTVDKTATAGFERNHEFTSMLNKLSSAAHIPLVTIKSDLPTPNVVQTPQKELLTVNAEDKATLLTVTRLPEISGDLINMTLPVSGKPQLVTYSQKQSTLKENALTLPVLADSINVTDNVSPEKGTFTHSPSHSPLEDFNKLESSALSNLVSYKNPVSISKEPFPTRKPDIQTSGMLEKESSASSDYMNYIEEHTVEAPAEAGLEPRETSRPSALLTATEVPPMQKLFSTTTSRMKPSLYLPAATVEGTELEPAFLKRNNVQQMFMMPSAVFLSGFAVVSDDICGSGNYAAEMNLNLGRELTPGDVIPPQGNLNVDINLKTNNSQIHLEIRSCCLSPTAQPDEINSTCCTFARLPLDSKDIRLLRSGQSKRARFTIQLFQMINYSTAYLHCELGICLKNHTECETQCFKQRKLYTEQGAIQNMRRSGNLISFGPMLKRSAEPSQEQYGSTAMKRIIILLGCVLGGSLLTCTFLFVWLAHRRRARNASMFQLGFMEFA
ncbi:uncharacterized protein LOC117397315 [Acipenser ruthenus]|uniref:uncharacterized protein LOC117397315 n=1 Tax=Acipenser ruthenus TaxID=7906 RepID=UPI00274086E9|nr:uncharacterized protein LOC117397315 [Acipenser ruthenus]